MTQDPRDRVVDWLTHSGFPLEMRVAAAWEQAGFFVAQSVYYVDPESADAREADILASIENITADAYLRVTVVVECKSRTDAGWVLFPSRGVPIDPSVRVRMLTAPLFTSPYLSRVARRADVRSLPVFAARQPAYAMAQAKTPRKRSQPAHTEKNEDNGKDYAYAAVMSVAKAASFLLDQVSHEREDDEFEILWPVIVTESPLYTAQLAPDGTVDVQSVSEGTLSWRHPKARGVLAIDVVHASVLSGYIGNVKAAVDLFLHQTSQELAASAARRTERRRAQEEAKAANEARAKLERALSPPTV